MHHLIRDTKGATATEFGLLVGLFILFLFGIIDAGRFAWTMNEAQKASQAGVRHAVVTDFVANGLDDYNFLDDGFFGGDAIPAAGSTPVTCINSGCGAAANVGGVVVPVTFDGTAFNGILARARRSFPALEADQLEVSYLHVGLGYAGDPNGSDIAPLVTVRITGVQFQPMILLGLSITLPDVDASMTMEDGRGSASYSA